MLQKAFFGSMLALALTLAPLAWADEPLEQLGNRSPQVAPAPGPLRLAPGVVVRLPDGRRSRIALRLPDGTFRTDDGVVITPDGHVPGVDITEPVVVLEPAPAGVPQGEVETPAAVERPVQETPVVVTPVPETPVTVETPAPVAPVVETPLPVQPPEQPGANAAEPRASKPETPPAVAETPAAPAVTPQPPAPQPQEERQVTLGELIPLTPIPQKPRQVAENTPRPAPKAEKPKPDPKAEKPRPDPQKEPAPPKQPKKPQQPRKPKVGEELRIPPEAAKTGNLDFLEGCWQGTRPEYYSKRIIRECFCFGAHGKNGKRRVLDTIGGRTCIGATRARLNGSGVLSVTSEGAACSDGERWGQAEMVCRGKGQKTPCSWVFKDANGGRQSYEIPFVRVESCGR